MKKKELEIVIHKFLKKAKELREINQEMKDIQNSPNKCSLPKNDCPGIIS